MTGPTFRLENLDPGSPATRAFRDDWRTATERENSLMQGCTDGGRLSGMQEYFIDAWCGHDVSYGDGAVLSGRMPPQVELEALVRGRAMVLTLAFNRIRGG